MKRHFPNWFMGLLLILPCGCAHSRVTPARQSALPYAEPWATFTPAAVEPPPTTPPGTVEQAAFLLVRRPEVTYPNEAGAPVEWELEVKFEAELGVHRYKLQVEARDFGSRWWTILDWHHEGPETVAFTRSWALPEMPLVRILRHTMP